MSRYALPHTLPDYFVHRPRLLVVGLNPASYAVRVGHYYARRSNRFWRLLVESGLAPGPLAREDDHRLPSLGIALTDLCKRPTPNVDDVTADEFRAGRARLARIARRISPGVIAFNGLAGFRAAYDPRAVAGLQPLTIAGRPVFVLPSSSARAGGTLSFEALLLLWKALRVRVDAESQVAAPLISSAHGRVSTRAQRSPELRRQRTHRSHA
ncbi:MAG: mismatch-specific DNA-glycosylase [Deltaproteobacteria bacterium]|nr:mismatch-specific DNA-glycosylase [Deltaproteobacteria bacterium]